MTEKIERNRDLGLWQNEGESNNDYAIRLCKEIKELSGGLT